MTRDRDRDGRLSPNILVLMADQVTPFALPFHGHGLTRAPTLSALAAGGVVFDAAYCTSPLCAPARSVFMTGRLPSKTGVYDNATDFRSDIPTFAHYLRAAGYRTSLSGKMHFCGPDQMHGFETRLTTDVYPADYGWTPDWTRPGHRFQWYHNMTSVLDAGPCVRSNNLDFDDEVVFEAERHLFDIARGRDPRPFCMVVSLTHPHDPFAIPRRFWDLYPEDAIDLPRVAIDPDDLDPHSKRLRHVYDLDGVAIEERHVRAARRAYYGAITYVDEQFGRVLAALEAAGLDQDTIVVFVSDHGEMLGERGLWYKMSFFEPSARIPLVISWPGRFAPGRVAAAVGLQDLLPTFLDLAGIEREGALAGPIEGHSLLPHLLGEDGDDGTVGEYLAEGALAPIVMIRRGRYKFVHSPADPDQLYDLADDPDERVNLAAHPAFADQVASLRREVAERWDLDALHGEVLASQRRRRLVGAALSRGERQSWDFQPVRDASRRYIRNIRDLDDLEAEARFPRVRTARQTEP